MVRYEDCCFYEQKPDYCHCFFIKHPDCKDCKEYNNDPYDGMTSEEAHASLFYISPERQARWEKKQQNHIDQIIKNQKEKSKKPDKNWFKDSK